jgi:AraC-like DNA-binding protein
MTKARKEIATPAAFALSQACQAAVGIVLATPNGAWPDWTSLSARFSEVPCPRTYADALHSSVVLCRFLERAGKEIHKRIHGGEIPSSCRFDSTIHLRLSDIDQQTPGSWVAATAFAHWVSEYSRDLANEHPVPIAERALARLNVSGSTRASEIARQVGCSVPALYRHFNRAVGQTPRQYTIHRRIERAIDLLQTTNWKVETIAREVGWRSKTNLHAAFGRCVGVSPARVRRLTEDAVADLRRQLHVASSRRVVGSQTTHRKIG